MLFHVNVIIFGCIIFWCIPVSAGITRKRVLNTTEHKRSIRSKNYQEGVGAQIKDGCGHGLESKAFQCHKFSEAMMRCIFGNVRRIGHEVRGVILYVAVFGLFSPKITTIEFELNT